MVKVVGRNDVGCAGKAPQRGFLVLKDAQEHERHKVHALAVAGSGELQRIGSADLHTRGAS